MTVNAEDLKGKKLSVVICYRGPKSAWFTKDGSIKKIDVDNRHKTLFDVIFPFLDIDDSQVFEMKIDKVCDFSDEITVSMAIDECKN
jgi:Holliday junction resolvase RusA-like endonuclease